ESQARRLLEESRAEAEQALAAARDESARLAEETRRRTGSEAETARAEAEAILLRARKDAERLLGAASA
ncbi:hypothetical protein G3M53_79955, partial [Streptomyces sp. SID7982]|nr:hypothetical protein [Streptomyces sp. SID7982]